MTGSVTISIELELAWGQHDKGGSDICSLDRSKEECYLNRLLETCDRYNVPVTFDVVGHLLLESCSGSHGGPHDGRWFSSDPGTDATTDPLFYWPQVAGMIANRETTHELATHTFSHVLCDEIDEQTLAWELNRCIEIHENAGFDPPTTIVTPRHRNVSYELLRNSGFEGIRTLKRHPKNSTLGRYKQRAIFWTLNRGHPVYEPERRDGLVELYTTPYPSLTAVHLPNGQLSPLWPFQQIPMSVRQRIQRAYLRDSIQSAIEEDSNVHLWTHLYNLSNEAQWECLVPFFERLGRARQKGQVEVLRMADLTNRY